MSHNWDGALPANFIAELPSFSGHRNAAGLVIISVPGVHQVVAAPFLPRALQFRYGLEGEALEAARKMVMDRLRRDLAPPPRERVNWWHHRWQDMV